MKKIRTAPEVAVPARRLSTKGKPAKPPVPEAAPKAEPKQPPSSKPESYLSCNLLNGFSSVTSSCS